MSRSECHSNPIRSTFRVAARKPCWRRVPMLNCRSKSRLTSMQIATVGKSLENVSFTARRELLRHEPTDLSRAQDCVRVCATISRRTPRLVGRAQRLEAATPRRHAVELTSCMGHRLRRSNACVAAVLAILNRFDLEGVDPCRDSGVPATQNQNQALRLAGILLQDRDVSVEELRYLVVRIRSNWRDRPALWARRASDYGGAESSSTRWTTRSRYRSHLTLMEEER